MFKVKLTKNHKQLLPFIALLIILLSTIVITSITPVSDPSSIYRVSNIYPGNQMGIQLPFIFLLMIGLPMLITGLFGSFLGILFLKLHKLLGKDLTYRIEILEEPEGYKRKLYSLIPPLISVSLAMALADNNAIIDLVVSPELGGGGEVGIGLIMLWSFLNVLPFTTLFAFIICTPTWLLLESGIVYSNRKKMAKRLQAEEISSVGGFYNRIIKGYTGIGVILAYGLLMYETFYGFDLERNMFESGLFGAMIFLALFPFIAMFFFTPAMIIFNMIREKGKRKIIEYAKNQKFS